MVRREPANQATGAGVDGRYYVAPPSIRTTGEIPAVTGEVRLPPIQPEVPDFPAAPQAESPPQPESPPSADSPSRSWSTEHLGEVPQVETRLSAVVQPRQPPASGGSASSRSGTGAPSDWSSPDVFASQTSVLPAVRTLRGDIFVVDRVAVPESAPGSATPANPSTPPIRIGDDDRPWPEIGDEGRVRLFLAGLAVAVTVALVALVVVGSILGLELP